MPLTTQLDTAEKPILAWRTHPLRREPKRLPVLLLTFALGASCVWMMFGAAPPVLAALVLMTLAISEYLFPTRYRIDETGATAEGGAGKLKIQWKETRRIVSLQNGILLSPLSAPSRLDSFRGILLRCAPDGEPGSRAEILALAAKYLPKAPEQNIPPTKTTQNAQGKQELPD